MYQVSHTDSEEKVVYVDEGKEKEFEESFSSASI